MKKIFLITSMVFLSAIFILFILPQIISDNITSLEVLAYGEALPKETGSGYDLFKPENNDIPKIKLELGKAIGAAIRIRTEDTRPTLLGVAFIEPNKNPDEVLCRNLISSKASGIWRSLAKVVPVPQSFHRNGEISSQIWIFETKKELIPGIWRIRFCGKMAIFLKKLVHQI